MLKRFIGISVLVAGATTAVLALDSKGVAYMGGTLSGVAEKSEGTFDMGSQETLVFRAKKAALPIEIPYSAVTELEYGQKAGRRVGVAIMISPLALFSKKRNHYLTISFKDKNGKEQAGVFELGKDIVRTTLKILEVRSGKDLKFQDAEACKQYKTPKECEAGK